MCEFTEIPHFCIIARHNILKIMIIIIIIIIIIYQNFTYNVRARESSLSKAKQNDIPRIRKEKNPSRGPLHLCQLLQRHAVLMGCEQSAPGVLGVVWIAQAARRAVLLQSRSRTSSRPQPCKCIILYVCGYCGRHLPCAASCMSGVRSGGAGAAEKKKLALFLALPIVLLPPFVCQPRTAQHG